MDGAAIIGRCRVLAGCSEETGFLTRTFLSPPMRDVHRHVRSWMEQAGLRVWVDAAGNIRGVSGDGPRLMIASHLDTVPRAGAFDGILGVMLGIALAASAPPVPLEVVGFSEEEGVRFRLPFIGSRAVAGDPVMDEAVLAAIRDYGLDPRALPDAALSADVRGYLEFHIEQGPVLERRGLPLGVVDAIVGQTRAEVRFRGRAGHAGTTPMEDRRDALAAAAEWIGAVERTAHEEGVVATVGSLSVEPGAVNVIPATVRASLDVRDAAAAKMERVMMHLRGAADEIGGRRGVCVDWEIRSIQDPVRMDAGMTQLLAAAVRATGYDPFRLASGAGHDAMILARKIPAAMLFLRSPGGISHHPDESVEASVVDAALAAGRHFLAMWRPQ